MMNDEDLLTLTHEEDDRARRVLTAAMAGINKPEEELTLTDWRHVASVLAAMVAVSEGSPPDEVVRSFAVAIRPKPEAKRGRKPKAQKVMTLGMLLRGEFLPEAKPKHDRAGRPSKPDMVVFAGMLRKIRKECESLRLKGKGRRIAEGIHRAMRKSGYDLPESPDTARRIADRMLKSKYPLKSPDENIEIDG